MVSTVEDSQHVTSCSTFRNDHKAPSRLIIQESEDENDDERHDTANSDGRQTPVRQEIAKTMELRGLVTQGRLSSVFESWLRPISIAQPTRPPNLESRKSVSEPKLALDSEVIKRMDVSDTINDEIDDSFEEMLDDIGLKGEKRAAMYSLSPDRKKYLVRQDRLSASDKGRNGESKSAIWYIDGLKSSDASDMKLVKHLITLRVRLSTAKLGFIQDFVCIQNGLDALEKLLAGLVGKAEKRKVLSEIENALLLEVIKCLRILLNTDAGFSEVSRSTTVITLLSYAISTSFLKVHLLVCEILAAICILSPTDGHKAVLAAFSDHRIVYEENFRFETLLSILRLPELDSDTESNSGYGTAEEGTWEARMAAMALINAMTNCPDNLEERMILREEFSRRGLNELIVALRYVKPPDSLLKQLNLYSEEKFEDEEDMHERTRNLLQKTKLGPDRPRPESEVALEELIVLAKQHDHLYPIIVDIFRRYGQILQRDVGVQFKADLFKILDFFVEQATMRDNFHGSWQVFLRRFAASVEHITGQGLGPKTRAECDPSIEEELATLRSEVEKLGDERKELRIELEQQVAEINILKALPLGISIPTASHGRKGGPEQNFHGLIQRLLQKEKQVLQLQTEVDRYNTQKPSEDMEAEERAKRERERTKWATMMDEVAKYKVRISELESALTVRDKEAVYLKRALESVYARFASREEIREGAKAAEVDAQIMAKRAIDRLTEKDEQMALLTTEISELKAKLQARPKTEREFKARSPPPPPPPSSKAGKPSPSSLDSLVSSLSLPPPPPPSTASTNSVYSIEAVPLPPPPPSPPLTPYSLMCDAHTPPSPPPPPPPPPTSILHLASGPPPPPPPPPPTGVLGPPAPLPTAFKMRSKFKPTQPAKRLKPFFWNKFNPTNTITVWHDLPLDVQVDLSDLEATFVVDSTPTSPSLLLSPKQNIRTVLDISRANNIAIMLKGIDLDNSQICSCLLEVDDTRLTIDDLRAIMKQLPTSEEVERIKLYPDVSKLAKADQYFHEIMSIPRLSDRLKCMLYYRRLELDIEEVRPELNILRNASRELRLSAKFRQTLQVVLLLGNTLNATSFRGGATGFHLNSLLKLKETKTPKGGADCPTVLHYLAKVLLRKDPSLATFILEMPNVEAAARVSVQAAVQTVSTLTSGLDHIKEEVELLKRIKPSLSHDRFVRVMEPFSVEMAHKVGALKNMNNSVESELRSLLTYFGEDPDSPETPKPEDFFGLVVSFSSSLQKCALEIHDKQNIGQRLVTSVAPLEDYNESTIKLSIENAPTVESQLDSQGQVGGKLLARGDMDQAIRSIREGKLKRVRPTRPISKIFVDGSNRRQSRTIDPTEL